jgi:ABC-2 type transport system permease protein
MNFPEIWSQPRRNPSWASIVSVLWRRDMLRFKAERSRWMGAVFQPLVFWALIGFGMGQRFQSASSESYVEYFFPGSLAMVVLFTAMFASMSIIEDRNTGFLQSVLVLPKARKGVLSGKLASLLTLALAQAALFLLFSPLANLDVSRFSGSLVVSLSLGTLGLSAFSLAGAWILNSIAGYHAIMALILFPLWVLSGAMFPMDSGWQALVLWANPIGYLVSGVRLSLQGQSLFDAAHFGVLAGLIGVFAIAFVLALQVMSRTKVQAV